MLIKYYTAHQYFYYDKKKYNLKGISKLVKGNLDTIKFLNARTKEDITGEILIKILPFLKLNIKEENIKNLIKGAL